MRAQPGHDQHADGKRADVPLVAIALRVEKLDPVRIGRDIALPHQPAVVVHHGNDAGAIAAVLDQHAVDVQEQDVHVRLL